MSMQNKRNVLNVDFYLWSRKDFCILTPFKEKQNPRCHGKLIYIFSFLHKINITPNDRWVASQKIRIIFPSIAKSSGWTLVNGTLCIWARMRTSHAHLDKGGQDISPFNFTFTENKIEKNEFYVTLKEQCNFWDCKKEMPLKVIRWKE